MLNKALGKREAFWICSACQIMPAIVGGEQHKRAAQATNIGVKRVEDPPSAQLLEREG
jgi:hypothetical protein